jgi:uncharacterized protein (DUF2147 family)
MPILHIMTPTVLFVATCLIAPDVCAQKTVVPDALPGLWKQIDDSSGRVQALVRIAKTESGVYLGFVEKIIPAPGDDPNPVCESCRDHRRNQPVLGMQIIEGLKRVDDNEYAGGLILDPDNGETYRLKIVALEKGAKLDVRGYIGIALFGRSQTWLRAGAER